MTDNYEHIHNATDARIAEMLDDNIRFDLDMQDPTLDPLEIDRTGVVQFWEWMEILKEASRRLKARSRAPFNSEAFDV